MIRNGLWLTAALLGTLNLSPAHASAARIHSITVAQEASGWLHDLETSAAEVSSEADKLNMMVTQPQIDPSSHGQVLMTLKEEINNMGREMATLDAERPALPEWEQEAVSHTLSLLKETAAATDTALQRLSVDRQHLWADTEYAKCVASISRDSEQMANGLKNRLALAKLRDREQRLDKALESASGE